MGSSAAHKKCMRSSRVSSKARFCGSAAAVLALLGLASVGSFLFRRRELASCPVVELVPLADPLAGEGLLTDVSFVAPSQVVLICLVLAFVPLVVTIVCAHIFFRH
jgi:hypothetical protein